MKNTYQTNPGEVIGRIPDTLILNATTAITGDLNKDGVVNLQDSIIGLTVLSGVKNQAIDAAWLIGGDNKLGSDDTIYILQKVFQVEHNY